MPGAGIGVSQFAADENSGWAIVRLVTDEELDNPCLLRDAKTFASKMRVPRRSFVDWLVDGVRDAKAVLLDNEDRPVSIDYDVIERDHIDLWFRDWAKRPEAHINPRVRAESRERVRLVVTMLRMIFPKESSVWGCDMPRC